MNDIKAEYIRRLTENIEDASVEESAEILAEIEALTYDDLIIACSKRFTV